MKYYSSSWMSLCLCVFLVVLLPFNACLGCVEEERHALLEFKSMSSSSDALLSWVNVTGSDCCAWERVKCNNAAPRRVIQLSLNATFSGGSLLNASLFLPFLHLQHLDLSDNYITESQGLERLSKLKKLEILNLGINGFNTSVVPSLGAITSLKTLLLAQNRLQGTLSEFSQVFTNLNNLEILDLAANNLNGFSPFHGTQNTSKLRILKLDENNLAGRIPPSILSLHSLQSLSLGNNKLNDSVSGFCKLKNLQELDLKENLFEGTLPLCLGELSSLRAVDFYQNELSGTIPFTLFSNLKSLHYLSLGRNHFQGIGSLTSFVAPKFQLRYLSLSDCNLNISSGDLLKLLHNQYDLRHLDIPNNKIHGKFPIWLIENNTMLKTMDLANNLFDGDIHFPPNRSSNIGAIDVSNNRIQGKIQPDIGDIFPELRYLNMSRNKLEGTIPTSLGKMGSLNVLDLSSNNLSGVLPESLAHNSKLLFVLILSNNRLHGQIPPAFFNLTYMNNLRLDNNQFTGVIPKGDFVFVSLYTLDLGKNNISGTIPSWIANLTVLTTLVLRGNSLVGPIPKQFCNFNTVKFMDLSQNHLSGPIPSCLLNLPELRYLQLQGNKLNGSLPMASPQYSGLLSLNLNHNQLSGSIPKWFGSLSRLRVLLLKENRFSGPVPRELCRLNQIGMLDLSKNSFSGSIPPCFSNITFGKTKSEELSFQDELWYSAATYQYTGLFGSIGPGSYAFLNVYNNQVEVEFMSKSYKGEPLISMSGIDISWNRFSGGIPLDIGALSAIRALSFSHNQLSGEIPKTLSNLKQLESLDLSFNILTGMIPSVDLKNLLVFSVAYNNLSGQVPKQLQNFGAASYKGNPSLCGPPLQKQC